MGRDSPVGNMKEGGSVSGAAAVLPSACDCKAEEATHAPISRRATEPASATASAWSTTLPSLKASGTPSEEDGCGPFAAGTGTGALTTDVATSAGAWSLEAATAIAIPGSPADVDASHSRGTKLSMAGVAVTTAALGGAAPGAEAAGSPVPGSGPGLTSVPAPASSPTPPVLSGTTTSCAIRDGGREWEPRRGTMMVGITTRPSTTTDCAKLLSACSMGLGGGDAELWCRLSMRRSGDAVGVTLWATLPRAASMGFGVTQPGAAAPVPASGVD